MAASIRQTASIDVRTNWDCNIWTLDVSQTPKDCLTRSRVETTKGALMRTISCHEATKPRSTHEKDLFFFVFSCLRDLRVEVFFGGLALKYVFVAAHRRITRRA